MGASANNEKKNPDKLIKGNEYIAQKNFNNDNNSNKKKENLYINESEGIFQNGMLKYHNKYRNMHGANNLNLTDELSEKATNYAKKLLESNSNFELNNFYKNQILGENILFSAKKKTEEEICNSWYDENNNYNYTKNTFQKDTNHFTQIIWSSTTEVGFGHYNIGEKYCYVALYYPQGNILGKFTENVLKAK